MRTMKTLKKSTKGAGLVEYGILTGLIALLALASVRELGEQIDFDYMVSALELYEVTGDLDNYLVNGDFDDVTGMTPTSWGYRAFSIEGWDEISGNNLPFEIHESGHGGMVSINGDFWLDTNASPGALHLSQTLTNLDNRKVYKITLYAGDRDTDLDGQADVYWNGQFIGLLDPTEEDIMQDFTFYIREGAGNGLNQLEIIDSGDNDNSGLALDEVRIYGPE